MEQKQTITVAVEPVQCVEPPKLAASLQIAFPTIAASRLVSCQAGVFQLLRVSTRSKMGGNQGWIVVVGAAVQLVMWVSIASLGGIANHRIAPAVSV